MLTTIIEFYLNNFVTVDRKSQSSMNLFDIVNRKYFS